MVVAVGKKTSVCDSVFLHQNQLPNHHLLSACFSRKICFAVWVSRTFAHHRWQGPQVFDHLSLPFPTKRRKTGNGRHSALACMLIFKARFLCWSSWEVPAARRGSGADLALEKHKFDFQMMQRKRKHCWKLQYHYVPTVTSWETNLQASAASCYGLVVLGPELPLYQWGLWCG